MKIYIYIHIFVHYIPLLAQLYVFYIHPHTHTQIPTELDHEFRFHWILRYVPLAITDGNGQSPLKMDIHGSFNGTHYLDMKDFQLPR